MLNVKFCTIHQHSQQTQRLKKIEDSLFEIEQLHCCEKSIHSATLLHYGDV